MTLNTLQKIGILFIVTTQNITVGFRIDFGDGLTLHFNIPVVSGLFLYIVNVSSKFSCFYN